MVRSWNLLQACFAYTGDNDTSTPCLSPLVSIGYCERLYLPRVRNKMEHRPLLSTVVRWWGQKIAINCLALLFQSFSILLQAQKGLYFLYVGKTDMFFLIQQLMA